MVITDETNGDRLSETHVVGALGGTDDVVINYSYNSRGQILNMTDGNGHLTNYTYDPNSNPLGQLSSITDAAGSTSYYGYDAAGNRTSVKDNEGNRTDFVFDNMNRLTDTFGALPTPSSSLTDRPHTHNEYYLNGQIKSVKDANEHTSYYYYDGLSRLIETKDGEGNSTKSHYDGAGNLDYSIDGRENITDYKYDARNRLITVTNRADGTHRDTEYNANDTVKSISDENRNKVKKFYDRRQRLINEVDAVNIPTLYNDDDIPLNNSTSYTYDAASQLIKVENARGKITTFEYDDLGRKISTTLPLNSNGNTTATSWTNYDNNGNVVKTIDANLNPTEYRYDNLNRRIETKDALGKITTYGYDLVGNLTLVTDANHHDTRYVYDGLNRQIETINALTQATLTSYDRVGNVKTVTEPTGHIMSYGYDRNNRRTTTSDERGVIQSIEYNQVGLAKTVSNAIGNSVTNTYDSHNRLIQAIDNFGVGTQTEYYDNGTVRQTIDPNGNSTEYVYDGNNRRTQVVKHVNGTSFTEYTVYDAVGNITATTDGEGHTTNYVYDDSNRRTNSIDPLIHHTYTDYDKVGNVVKTTDALGRFTTSSYDKLNRQISVTQAFGTVDATTTSYGYDDVGNLIAETDGRHNSLPLPIPAVPTTTYTYDKLNRRVETKDVYDDVTKTEYYDTPGLIATAIAGTPTIIYPTNIGKIVKQIDANQHSTISVYDLQGHLTDTYDALGHRTSHQTYYIDDRMKTSVDTFGQVTNYSYDDAQRHTIILDSLGVTTTKKSDKVGNLIEKTDSEGRTTSYVYDELNRQETITDAVGGITCYTYDNNGQTTSILDAALNLTSYDYDDAGRLFKEHTALGDRIYGYDDVNNRTSTIDRNGRGINYSYDNLDRVKSELWDNGKQFTYTYDRNSNLTSADDGSRHYDYTYDDTDLLMREDRSGGTSPIVSFKYDYDAVGNLTQTDELIAGSLKATTIYAYDARNLNSEIAQSGAGLTAKRVKFTYDTQGQNTQIERYLGAATIPVLTTDNTYDPYGRLIEIKQSKGSNTIADSLYGFDNLSRLISETKDGVNRLVSYDKIDQVKTVTGSNSEAYSYDANGNRTSGGNVAGVNNQLTTDGVYNYTYDGEGNRTRRTNIVTHVVDEYAWDYRNRLTGIVSKDGGGAVLKTVGYEYDVDDQRVSKTVDGVVENYYLDGEQVAFVTDGGGNETFHYLYGTNIDSVLAQDSSTGMVWSLSDRLGTVDTLTDAGGMVVDKRNFDSFGRVLSETNPSVSFRYGYTGRERDLESGLDYYRARYYDPTNGVFISVDPAGFGAGDTNLYRYVGNSSTMATDPTGMWSFQEAWNGAGQLWNNGVQAVQDFAYDRVVQADRVVAGVAGFATNGYTDRLRNEWYGDKIAGQSDSFEYALGQSLGFGITTVLGALTIGRLATSPAVGNFAGSFLTKKILTAAATSVGLGIVSDLAFPGLLQAPKHQNDNKSLPTHYENQKLTFELLLGVGIDKAPGIAKAGWSRFNQLADSAEPFIEKGISSLNRFLGRGYSTVPIPVEGFLEEAARKASSSLGWFVQGNTQSTAVLANNATNIYQHYFAASVTPGGSGGSAGTSGTSLTSVPSVKNDEFKNWFNSLTPDELNQVWGDKKLRESIEARLRSPGGLHEWHMVSRAPKFKAWGVSAEEIADMRTVIKDVKFVNPTGKHGGKGSTKAHNEILEIIDTSPDRATFVRRLQTWANYRLDGGADALPVGLKP